MRIRIGEVEALFRYPVKSMRGERLEVAQLGWHGVVGDRRLAFRKYGDHGGFPWLTASTLPELLRFTPRFQSDDEAAAVPTHVLTPDGEELPAFGQELASDVARRHGSPVEMVHLSRGIFDEACISLITSSTVAEIGRLAVQPPDVRRYRPNILIALSHPAPFAEEAWVGGVLSFGERPETAALFVTNRDERCAMVNYSPDSARPTAEVLKAIVRARANMAGVYAAVTRRGCLAVGQPIFFEPVTG
jgi:uncharacterized protein YcbX